MSLYSQLQESCPVVSKEERYDKVQELVDMVNFSEMSSIKSSVSAIIRVINDPRSTVKELKEVILTDPPLAARVLKTANSAYYSRNFSRSFSDIEQAIIWMGSEIIKELALSQKVCEIFDKKVEFEEYSRQNLWRHCVAVAFTAKAIYRREFGLKGENAYVAGLLHDVGIIAEDQFLRERFEAVLRYSRSQNIDLPSAEQKLLDFDHAEVGGAICSSWGLPDMLVSSTTYHHSPQRAEIEFSKLSATVYISDFVCQDNGYGYGISSKPDEERIKDCLHLLEVKPYALNLIFKSVKAELMKMEDKGLL